MSNLQSSRVKLRHLSIAISHDVIRMQIVSNGSMALLLSRAPVAAVGARHKHDSTIVGFTHGIVVSVADSQDMSASPLFRGSLTASNRSRPTSSRIFHPRRRPSRRLMTTKLPSNRPTTSRSQFPLRGQDVESYDVDRCRRPSCDDNK